MSALQVLFVITMAIFLSPFVFIVLGSPCYFVWRLYSEVRRDVRGLTPPSQVGREPPASITPAVGDQGQRYEVTFVNPASGARQVAGWSETRAGADRLVRGINAHPSWHSPEIKDRRPHECLRCKEPRGSCRPMGRRCTARPAATTGR